MAAVREFFRHAVAVGVVDGRVLDALFDVVTTPTCRRRCGASGRLGCAAGLGIGFPSRNG
ncbi:hypothetical protein A8926_4512 [Saccharopolyspora spinosa]|uniref:Uncharacterized protein n=2 Tax=Saccharopolyspora spinosa TaxID=60894 RepID=A0A2N3Y149_SACSN|nr:hypothetical protein A8926_4512 [Saccharopolyspora spinosa]